MKALFTGTEQDLIECGFKAYNSYVFNKKLEDAYYIRYQVTSKRGEQTYQVFVINNIIYAKQIFVFGFIVLDINKNKFLIQDLIDKNLVR